MLELSWRSIHPKFGRPLGSFPPGHEPKGKGYGKLQGGRIDYASLVDYEDLPLTGLGPRPGLPATGADNPPR